MRLLILWLCVMGVSMLMEMLTSSYITMWFAIGGVFAIVFQLLGLPWYAQLLVFLIVSFLSLFLVRHLFAEFMETGHMHIRTLEEKMLSRQAVLTKDATFEGGSVFIDGKLMKAKTSDEEIRLIRGTVVEVVAVEDGVLVIEEAKKVKEDEGTLAGNARKKVNRLKFKKGTKKSNDKEAAEATDETGNTPSFE